MDLTGADSTAQNSNTVDAGAGDDVVVLSTDADSVETVVFTGSFGSDVIVNFTAGTGAGGDVLDFKAALGGSDAGVATAFSATNRIVTVIAEDTTNDTIAEIKALFDADAAEDATASLHLYIAHANQKGNVYLIEMAPVPTTVS